MQKFFSFLKNKKILFFVFLFVIFIFTSFPHIVSAADTTGWNNDTDRGKIIELFKSHTPDNYDENHWSSWSMAGLETAICHIIVNAAFKIAALTNLLISYVLGAIISAPITTTSANNGNFYAAWGQVRNLGNMLIVLGFVVVGIATALRIREYEAKKLLWPLVLAAILINFSGLFCGLIIDAGNLVTGGLTNSGGLGNMPNSMLSKVADSSYGVYLTKSIETGLPNIFCVSCLLFTIIYLMIAFTFLYMTVLLIARYAILIMLYVLSPLAFAFWIFPASKKLWSDWWNHFVKWCFVGVYCAFALWMAGILLNATPANGTAGSTDLWQLAITTALVLIFLFVGLSMSTKSSGIASSAVIGMATGAAGLAMGAVVAGGSVAGAGAKVLDRLTGGKGAAVANRVSSATGRAMENIGLRARGTTAGNAGKEMKEASGRIENMDQARQTQLAQGKGMMGVASAADRTAAIQNKIKSGRLSDLGDHSKQAEHLAYAESYMKSKGLDSSGLRKEAMTQNPNLALQGAATKDPKVIAQRHADLKAAVQRQTPAEFAKNIDRSSLTAPVLGAMDNNQMAYLANKGSMAKKGAMRDLVHTPTGKSQIASHLHDAIGRGDFAGASQTSANYSNAKVLF